jgi:hypothetical protein
LQIRFREIKIDLICYNHETECSLHKSAVLQPALTPRDFAPIEAAIYGGRDNLCLWPEPCRLCAWQIELVFKRFKQIAQLGHLPKNGHQSARAWLYGKLFVALLVEKLLAHANSVSPWGYPLQIQQKG